MRKSEFTSGNVESGTYPQNLAGDPRSIARAITLVENGGNDASAVMKAFFRIPARLQLSELRFPRARKISLVDKLGSGLSGKRATK